MDLQHLVDGNAHLVECLSLCDGTRETVKNVTVRSIRLCDAVLQDTDDDIIRDQRTAVHRSLCAQPQLSAVLDGLAEHIAGRDLRDAELCGDCFRLRAFAGTGRTQENKVHMAASLQY